MAHVGSSLLSQFQHSASELRRDRADLDAKLARLARICAETVKLNAESDRRIARSLAALERSASRAPEAQHNPELGGQHRPAPVSEQQVKRRK